MSTDIPHPDRLGPGDSIGPWRILAILGAGGLGRVFKVEREGRLYALKMALRPPGEKLPGEEDVDGRSMREATAMMGRSPHPNIPRIFQVGRWPDPEAGFLFVVMEYVDGWSFHDWRFEARPTAAQLVDVMRPIVRTVAELHRDGIHHRDLHEHNVLIRKEDGRPFLLDFGSVRLPGARTLTQGLPPVNLAAVPPEALEHLRLHGDDVRFEGGPAADLYALGTLLYNALTGGLPFNPELAPERLLATILLRSPRAPHRVNPKVPPSLSAITMRLLAKRPEDRFESAEALHQALWDANKERTSRAWKVPLNLPESGPAPITDEEMEVWKREEEEVLRAARLHEQDGDAEPPRAEATEGPPPEEGDEQGNPAPVRRTRAPWARVRRPVWRMAAACALVAGLVALASWWSGPRPDAPPRAASHASAPTPEPEPGQEVATPGKPPEANRSTAPSPEGAVPTPASIAVSAMPSEDSTSVKTLKNVHPRPSSALRTVRKTVGTAVTCSVLAGCSGAQVRPPPPVEKCPEGAVETMAKWGIQPGERHLATFPLEDDAQVISVSEGWTTIFITGGRFDDMPGDGRLTGQLIFGERVLGRITRAHVDDQTFPVCFELEDGTKGGRGLVRRPNGGPGEARVFSTVYVKAVREFE